MEREEMELLTNQIRNALTRAREQLTAFGEQIRNNDVIIFLGNTRSGKSTVINYLIGTNLLTFLNELQEYKIKKADENADGPCIGQGTISKTDIPGVYQSNDDGALYVDAPGFGDNRGDAQEIINSIFIKEIKSARNCIFVLVSDINDIRNDNVNGFVRFIESLHDLISSSSLCHSVSLVITKVEEEKSRTNIGNLLNTQIVQSNMSMKETSRELVRHFVEHNERIALFRKPSRKGVITATIDVNIGGAISSCLPLRMNTVPVRCAISDGAQLALLEICHNFIDELHFTDELNAGNAEYRNYFVVDDYVYASTEEELDETKDFVTNWKLNLTNARNTNHLNIQEILDSITALIQLDSSTNFYKTLTLFAMLENVEVIQDTIRNSLIQKYRDSLDIVIEKANNLINKIDAEQRERRDLNLAFTLSVVKAGVDGLAGTLELIAQGMRARGSSTDSVDAVGGLLRAAASIVDTVRLSQERNDHIERRSSARQRQER